MHRRVTHPKAGVLSVDVSGPYVKGHDLDKEAKFMLVGAFAALRSRSVQKEAEKIEDVEEGPVLDIQDESGMEDQDMKEGEDLRLEAAGVGDGCAKMIWIEEMMKLEKESREKIRRLRR